MLIGKEGIYMCGIVGYLGQQDAKKIVLDGLKRLEYRGYDSAGMSLYDPKQNGFKLFKEKGRIAELEKQLTPMDAIAGIGHTRWATHGKVNRENAHPHISLDHRFTIVHNGVIDNHKALKRRYFPDHVFSSETDTEVIVELVALFAKQMPVLDAIRKTLKLLHGSYALLVIDHNTPETLYAAKHKSPLLMGQADHGMVIGSDMMALIGTAESYMALNDETFLRMSKDHVTIYDLDGEVVPYEMAPFKMDALASDKGEFPHYMLKEIYEQPTILRRIISKFFNEDGLININETLLNKIRGHKRIHILAAGTSMHAGLIGKVLFEQWTGLPTEVHIASEFAYQTPLLGDEPYFILISQSGETADLRACLLDLKRKKLPTLTITNVITSTLAREADDALEIFAGPEIAVASTKAYTAQIAVLSILAFALSHQTFDLKRELSDVAIAMEDFLDGCEGLETLVKETLIKDHCFYIGRGTDYHVSLEAALKLKEISYIHTEGFAAGELKHGTIALIEPGTPVIAIISNDKTAENTRSNLSEVQSRGASTLTITFESLHEPEDHIVLKNINPSLSPLLTVLPTQLIAYHAALILGHDIDKPRNLAKSVTVE